MVVDDVQVLSDNLAAYYLLPLLISSGVFCGLDNVAGVVYAFTCDPQPVWEDSARHVVSSVGIPG